MYAVNGREVTEEAAKRARTSDYVADRAPTGSADSGSHPG